MLKSLNIVYLILFLNIVITQKGFSTERSDCSVITTESGSLDYVHKDETASCFVFNGTHKTYQDIKLALFTVDGVPAYASFEAEGKNDTFFLEKGAKEHALGSQSKGITISFWSNIGEKYKISTMWHVVKDAEGNNVLYVVADYSNIANKEKSNLKNDLNSKLLFTPFTSSNTANQTHPSCSTDNTSPKNPNNHVWNLHSHIEEAASKKLLLVVSPVSGLLWFGNQVKVGGIWDIKQHYGNDAEAENFGNFNYGATGAAMGLPYEVLTRVAGAAQTYVNLRNGTYDPSDGIWYGNSPYGDEIRDQEWIVRGYNYFHQVFDEAGNLVDDTRDLCNLNNELGERYVDSSGGTSGGSDSGEFPDSGGVFGDAPSCTEITGTGCSCGENSCVCEDQTVFTCE